MEKQQHLKTKQNKKGSLVVYGNNITQLHQMYEHECPSLGQMHCSLKANRVSSPQVAVLKLLNVKSGAK